MQAKIDHVVFDFDGTLVDSNHIKRDLFFEVSGRVKGGRAVMEKLHGQVPGDRYALWQAWATEMGRDDGAEQADIYSAEVDAAVAAAPEMPGATSMLEALNKAGLALFISSATPRDNLVGIVANRGWTETFQGIFGRPESKPDILDRYILPKTGTADRVAVVGDGADDRDSAAGAGCHFFPVGEARGAPQGGDARVYTLPDLADCLT